jgi:hypothetical protein
MDVAVDGSATEIELLLGLVGVPPPPPHEAATSSVAIVKATVAALGIGGSLSFDILWDAPWKSFAHAAELDPASELPPHAAYELHAANFQNVCALCVARGPVFRASPPFAVLSR